MKRARQTLAVIMIIAPFIVIGAFVVPEPQALGTTIRPGEFKPTLATTALMTWLNIGAALLFLVGLDVFKKSLRQAYRLICIGLTFLGVALIQIPLLIGLELFESSWVRNGGLALPYVVAWLLIFMGLRSFAKTLGDTSKWTTASVVLPLVVVFSIISGLLTAGMPDREFSSLSLAGSAANILIALLCVVVTVRIKRIAGPAYTNALAWFVLPMGITALGIYLTILYDLLDIQGGVALGIPFAVSAVLFLKAGYAFNKIREY